MKVMKYYLSLLLFVVLCIFDILFAIMVLALIDKGAFAVFFGVFFFVCSLLLTKACLDYHKKFSQEQKPADKQVVFDDDEADEPVWVSSIEKPKKKVGQDRPMQPEFEIRYIDAAGRVSVRQIYVIDFDGRLLEAYCFLRNEERSFIVDRIDECVDLSTGEVVDDDLCKFFAKYSSM